MDLRGLFVLTYLLFAFGILAVILVLQGFGLFRMAKNAGVPYAWTAFLPVGNGYVMGMLADRSRYLYTGNSPRLGLAFWLPVTQVMPVFGGLGMFGLVLTGGSIFNFLVGLFFVSLFAGAIAAVFFYIYAVYYILKDYAPDNAVLFTVLGILFNICWVFLLVEMNTVPVSVTGFKSFPNGRPRYGRQQPWEGTAAGQPTYPSYQRQENDKREQDQGPEL